MSNSKRKAHCNKKPFKTLLAAQIGLTGTVRASKKRDAIVTGLSVYKCPYCDFFHIGRSRAKGINWGMVAAQDIKIQKIRAAAQTKEGPT